MAYCNIIWLAYMASIWLALVVVAMLAYFLQELMRKKKKLPPGPRGLPLIGNLHLDFYKIAKEYGPIMSMRFGLVPVVVASSPYAAEQ